MRIVKKVFLWIIPVLLVDVTAFAQTKPNVLLVLADDLGWSDLSCYGNPIIQTPNIDQLAREGMRFTDAYADPVCAPTRAAIQTGQYSARLQMTGVPNGHRRPYARVIPPRIYWRLDGDYVTIAEAIRASGYVSGIFGKWHLGYDEGHQPTDQGYIYPENKPFEGAYAERLQAWVEANPYKSIGNHVKHCVQFIEQNRDRPFFCFASFTAVHTRPEARPELIDKYKKIVATNRTITDPVYAAMCEMMDEAVGLLREALSAWDLEDNTIILFYSDNGGVVEERGFLYDGYTELVTNNWPLRNEKGSLYEGGIRVPLIARWPGHIEAGSVNRNMVHCIDILPTMLEITGSSRPEGQILDGVSILPVLVGAEENLDRDLFWHYPHYHHSTPASAVRSGDYKLIWFYETDSYELYNLTEDIGEQYDLADIEPEKARELDDKLQHWLVEEVHAGLPTPNPFYDPKRKLIWGERIDREMIQKGYGYGLEHR